MNKYQVNIIYNDNNNININDIFIEVLKKELINYINLSLKNEDYK